MTDVNRGYPVRLQNLRLMTVRVALPDGGPTLGTGVAIARQGLIVTCRHVLEDGGLDVTARQPLVVDVHFPAVDHWKAVTCRATVVAFCADTEDDMVCLRTDGLIPAERVAVLGDAAASEWNEFVSYGYRRLGKYQGLFAQGTILGEIEAAEGSALLEEPVQLSSSGIAEGMSGAPVLDRTRNLVVGLIAEKWGSGGLPDDRDTAWAVNAHLVTFPPFSLVVREDPLPMLRMEPPQMDDGLLRRILPPRSDRLEDAPSLLTEWVGREEILAEADHAADDPETLVVSLVGFGGEGKTTIARQWLDRRRTATRDGQTQEPRYFWWSFAERAGADDFLEAALDFVSGAASRRRTAVTVVLEPRPSPRCSIPSRTSSFSTDSKSYRNSAVTTTAQSSARTCGTSSPFSQRLGTGRSAWSPRAHRSSTSSPS